MPLGLDLLVSLAACSQPTTRAAGDHELTGLWRMTSLEVGSEGELKEIPYAGQIAFTGDTVSVQAMNPDTETADSEFTFGGYEAFYGNANVDREAGKFAVKVESAAARDLG